jgi:hypothetical protein
MRLTVRSSLVSLVLLAGVAGLSGCTATPDGDAMPAGTGGSPASSGSGGSHAGSGGSVSSGGSTGSGGTSTGSGGAAGSEATGGSGAMGGSGAGTGGSEATGGTSGGTGGSSDAAAPADTTTPPPTGDPTSVDGEIKPYEGPPVGPEVKMDCPDDPLAGFTEYKDTFHVEHPYDLPTSARFSIEGGIYNFWVMQGDKRHSATSTAKNPRTEARFTQNFRTGIRMFSGDVFWEPSVTKGTVVMQVHTTSTGIGPVYMVANGANVSPINASKVPGGLIGRWINLKVLINATTTASQYWINNCPVATQGSGTRGDGNDYFKMGVYHCDSGTCRAKWKNVHLYMKQ